MTSNKPFVLVTGASGHIGAHTVKQALEAGYRVRITARPFKVDALKEKYGGKVEVVGIADIAKDDYSEALKDIDAVLHMAAPLPGEVGAAEMVEAAVGGAMNIIRQAAAKGVKRVVYTSTMLTLPDVDKQREQILNTNLVMSEKFWNPATRESLFAGEHSAEYIYGAAKVIAEREVWKFADEHPEIDITTILPPVTYGPLESTKVAKGDTGALAMTAVFYNHVLPKGGSSVELVDQFDAVPYSLFSVDVRDVAKAHVLALSAPLEKEAGRKRILVSCGTIPWLNAVEHLRTARPELADRLPDTSKAVKRPTGSVDVSKAANILGLTEYIDWKKTVEDTADCLLAIERQWAETD